MSWSELYYRLSYYITSWSLLHYQSEFITLSFRFIKLKVEILHYQSEFITLSVRFITSSFEILHYQLSLRYQLRYNIIHVYYVFG